ncbi:organ specific protein [Artemisia annua]|uniref:Organ specific protein n=1 Tax=Artemisia annua TaxID=35608 RepID=A0A2U1LBC6_ARTAN|nr:organ specific protein [Artemisia annua]
MHLCKTKLDYNSINTFFQDQIHFRTIIILYKGFLGSGGGGDNHNKKTSGKVGDIQPSKLDDKLAFPTLGHLAAQVRNLHVAESVVMSVGHEFTDHSVAPQVKRVDTENGKSVSELLLTNCVGVDGRNQFKPSVNVRTDMMADVLGQHKGEHRDDHKANVTTESTSKASPDADINASKSFASLVMNEDENCKIVSYNEARSNPREYWRSIMRDEPMPKTIQDVLPLGDVKKINKNIFMKNFDLKPNLIIYHTHDIAFPEKNHHIGSSSSTSSDELN